MSSFSRSPNVWPVSPVGREGRRLAHVAALSQVDRDAERQRTGGQEERRSVDPEAVAGASFLQFEVAFRFCSERPRVGVTLRGVISGRI
jgi:hypothetical protein